MVLGGSWVVISRVITPLIWVQNYSRTLLIAPLITTHDPSSRDGIQGLGTKSGYGSFSLKSSSGVLSTERRAPVRHRPSSGTTVAAPPQVTEQGSSLDLLGVL